MNNVLLYLPANERDQPIRKLEDFPIITNHKKAGYLPPGICIIVIITMDLFSQHKCPVERQNIGKQHGDSDQYVHQQLCHLPAY